MMTQRVVELEEPTPRHRYGRWLALAAVLVGAGLFLLWQFDPGQLPLPLCAFHTATGLHCAGCGATRAMHELLHGRVLAALHHNAFWVMMLPLALYIAASEARNLLRGRPLPGNPSRKPWLYVTIGAIALVFFVLRNVPAYPFNLLAPP